MESNGYMYIWQDGKLNEIDDVQLSKVLEKLKEGGYRVKHSSCFHGDIKYYVINIRSVDLGMHRLSLHSQMRI